MERQGVDDEIDLAWWGEGLQPIKEVEPGRRVACGGGL
jgi:hypothetical protein